MQEVAVKAWISVTHIAEASASWTSRGWNKGWDNASSTTAKSLQPFDKPKKIRGCYASVVFTKPKWQAKMAAEHTLIPEKALPLSSSSYRTHGITGTKKCKATEPDAVHHPSHTASECSFWIPQRGWETMGINMAFARHLLGLGTCPLELAQRWRIRLRFSLPQLYSVKI